MTHYYKLRLGALLLLLFFAHVLSAQWEPVLNPGSNDTEDLYLVNGALVAFAEDGCYRSVDDGITWGRTLPFESYYTSMNANSTDVYVIIRDEGLYHSNDGLNWTKLTGQTPGANHYPDGLALTEHYIQVESYSGLFRYDKTNPVAPETVLDFGLMNYPNTLVMKSEGNDIWVAVNDSLLHSNDEGDTWSLVHEGIRASGIDVKGDTILLTSWDGGLQRSVNKGVTWAQFLNGNLVNQPYHIGSQWFVNVSNSGYVDINTSFDGGATWTDFSTLLDQYSIYKIARFGNTTFGCGYGGIARTTDGQYWEYCNGGLGNANQGSFGGRIDETDDYLVFERHFSANGGQTWFQPLLESNTLTIPLVKHNGYYFGFDYGLQLYRTSTDFHQKESIGDPFPSGLSYRLIATENHLYRVDFDVWGGVASQLNESTDNGLTWQGTGAVQSNFNLIAHGDYLFVWNDGTGLFRTLDGGQHWESVGAGLTGLEQFNGDVVLYSTGARLFAYDSYYIYASDNDGLTFTRINENLLHSGGFPIGPDAFSAEGNIAVASTYDGVFLNQAPNDTWFDITGDLPNFNFYDEKITIHDGYIYFDGGFSVNTLWRRSLASLNLGQVAGKVWLDSNNNGTQEPGEQPYAGAFIQAGASAFSTSDVNGAYELFADFSNDTLRLKKSAPWVITNPEYYLVNTSATGKDFGLYFPPNITDLQVALTNQTVFRPGFTEHLYITYQNLGTADAHSNIQLTLDAPLEFESSYPAPDNINGNQITWNQPTLVAFSDGQIVLSVKVPATTTLGSYVSASVTITPDQTDANSVDNQAFLKEIVVGSYDPNDKRCDFSSITPEDVQAREALTYTIRFQNTGTYPAEFVRILDTLDFTRLDVSTFQVLATSHPCVTTLRGNGIADFFFDQIDLAPSELNEPESHGFVKYSIKPKVGLALGQQIHNTAYIYFDFNAPIITNTTETGVALHVGTSNLLTTYSPHTLLFTPNPTNGLTRLRTEETGSGTLRVFNALGEMVLEKAGFSATQSLDLSGLAPGLYSLEWRLEDGSRKVGRVIRG